MHVYTYSLQIDSTKLASADRVSMKIKKTSSRLEKPLLPKYNMPK